MNIPEQPNPESWPQRHVSPQVMYPRSTGERVAIFGKIIFGLSIALTSYHALAGMVETDNMNYCAQNGANQYATHKDSATCDKAFTINHDGLAGNDHEIYELPDYDDHIAQFFEGLAGVAVGFGMAKGGKAMDETAVKRMFSK